MEFAFYTFVFIAIVFGVAGFVQTIVYPPMKIGIGEVPQEITGELQTCFLDFDLREVTLQKVRHRYRLKGSRSGLPCKFTIDLTPDGELAELKFDDISSPHAFTNETSIPSASVPVHLANLMNPFLVQDPNPMHWSRAYSGMIGNENGYKVKTRSEDFRYEFEMTESGRLVEFEKKHLHH